MGAHGAGDGTSRFFVVRQHSLLCVRCILLLFGVGGIKAAAVLPGCGHCYGWQTLLRGRAEVS